MEEESVPPPASPSAVDIATVNAGVASLRADLREVNSALSALKAGAAAQKGDLASVPIDVVRLEQKCARMAEALSAAQADIRRILELMATKDDAARILAALDALARKR